MHSHPSFARLMLAVQIFGAFAVPLGLTLLPPARGAMLLVPLRGASAIRFARARGAVLIRRGWIPGSVVVLGDRDRLAREPMAVLAVAADAAGCGNFPVRA